MQSKERFLGFWFLRWGEERGIGGEEEGQWVRGGWCRRGGGEVLLGEERKGKRKKDGVVVVMASVAVMDEATILSKSVVSM